MKLLKGSACLTVLFSWSLVGCRAATVRRDLICAESDPSDCYPKIFEPTENWQIIREGQDIPPNLHVRLNMDTLVKEAKLMEAEDTEGKALEVVEQPSSEEAADSGVDKATDSRIYKAPPETVDSFDSAVQVITSSNPGASKLDQALDVLIDLSHDIEFGVRLTQDRYTFQAFHNILSFSPSFNVKEKVYRIMGSSLRNNPEAIQNLVSIDPENLIATLFNDLDATSSDVLQKRILGVIQALNQNQVINARFFNVNKKDDFPNYGITQLMKNYPNLGTQSRSRFVNILQDLNLLAPVHKRDGGIDANPDTEVSNFLQRTLVQNSGISESQVKSFFRNLREIHTSNKSLEPSEEFMNWLSEEVVNRQNDKKQRDTTSPDDDAFDEELLKARHLVFGNPNAMRKAMAEGL